MPHPPTTPLIDNDDQRRLSRLAEMIPNMDKLMIEAAMLSKKDTLTPPPSPDAGTSDIRLSLLTERQRELVWFYEVFGVVGLCFWIYYIALIFILEETEQKETSTTSKTSVAQYAVETENCFSDIDSTDTDIDDRNPKTASNSRNGHVNRSRKDTNYDEVGDGGHRSWRDVRDDFEKGSKSRMLYALASLPPELIPAILYGDLPFRMQDETFFQNISAWVELSSDPGTYGAFLAVSKTVQARRPQIDDYIGKKPADGPCLDHILQALKMMKLYANIDNRDFAATARKIDMQCDPTRKISEYDYSKQRKYGGGKQHRSFDLLNDDIDWLLQVYERLESNIRSTGELHLLKAPMRCPVYMGMSGNPSSRGPQHKGRPESKLLGLFVSTLKYLCKDLYDIGSYTFQLFRSVREEDIGLLEVVIYILGSGFPWDGGLAYTHAGGRPRGIGDIHRARMKRAAAEIRSSGNIERNPRDSENEMKRLQEILEQQDSGGSLSARDESQAVKAVAAKVQQQAEVLKAKLEASQINATFIDLLDCIDDYEATQPNFEVSNDRQELQLCLAGQKD